MSLSCSSNTLNCRRLAACRTAPVNYEIKLVVEYLVLILDSLVRLQGMRRGLIDSDASQSHHPGNSCQHPGNVVY